MPNIIDNLIDNLKDVFEYLTIPSALYIWQVDPPSFLYTNSTFKKFLNMSGAGGGEDSCISR